MQWAIFALRNATAGHQANQDVLAGVSNHGVLQDSALLHELGLRVENGKIVKR